jgi:predicted transcriptional regulator
LITKFAWSGVAVVLALVMALGVITQTVTAAAPTTVNVIIDEGLTATGGDSASDDDSRTSDPNNAQVVSVVVDVDDANERTDQTLVQLTTTVGTWSNGSTSIQIQCGLAAAAAILAVTVDDDPAADLQRAEGRYLYFRPEEVELP